MIKFRRSVAAVEAFMLYLLTGASCLVVGSSLPQLMEHFHAELVAVAALVSAFAIGRIATVFFVGMLTERLGPKRIVGAGLALLIVFLGGVPLARSIPAAMVMAALGGAGMGTQDAACPVILTEVFPAHYPSAMSAGQAFFGAGCFLPSLVMGFMLKAGLPFYWMYYVFAGLGALMLILLPLMKIEIRSAAHDTERIREKKERRQLLPLFLFAAICLFYCAATGTMNLYATSYAAYRGLAPEQAVSVLTAYNVGNMVGSILFVLVLRRIKPLAVLRMNLAAALLLAASALFANGYAMLAASYFGAGFFLGVLFSVALTLAVDLFHGRAGRAGAVLAMISGSADIVTPLITGTVVTAAGIGASAYFAIGFIAMSLTASMAFGRARKT